MGTWPSSSPTVSYTGIYVLINTMLWAKPGLPVVSIQLAEWRNL